MFTGFYLVLPDCYHFSARFYGVSPKHRGFLLIGSRSIQIHRVFLFTGFVYMFFLFFSIFLYFLFLFLFLPADWRDGGDVSDAGDAMATRSETGRRTSRWRRKMASKNGTSKCKLFSSGEGPRRAEAGATNRDSISECNCDVFRGKR